MGLLSLREITLLWEKSFNEKLINVGNSTGTGFIHRIGWFIPCLDGFFSLKVVFKFTQGYRFSENSRIWITFQQSCKDKLNNVGNSTDWLLKTAITNNTVWNAMK